MNHSLPQMRSRVLGRLLRSLLAALVPPLGAFALQLALWPVFAPFAWLLFYPAVFISAWLANVFGGIVATMVSTALVWWHFIPPVHTLGKGVSRSLLSAGVFVATGVLFSVFHGHLRRAYRDTAAALAAAGHANEQLKQVVNERRIFAALIQNSSDFVGIADPAGRPVYVNPAGRRMVGLAPDYPVEQTQIPEYYPPEQREFASTVIVKSMVERGHWQGETWFRNWQTGASIPVSDTHFVIHDPETGHVLGMGTITRDISDVVRGREEALLFEVAKSARASAEEANRAKDQFLATLSHELRTPLTSLLLQVQRLRRGNMDETRLDKACEIIERAAKAQAQLIGDLLDISRIVSGKLKMEMEAVDLCSIVRAAVDTVGSSAERREIDVALHLDDSLPPVSGDPMRLQQVVLNLLTNAVKFTPERGRVTVTVDDWEGRGRIRVMDTGIGIEPEFLPHLFSRFSQEDRGQARAHGGLGLGLAIARHIVEAHGGTIHAESDGKGRGSTFTLLLPLITQGRKAFGDGTSKRGAAPGGSAVTGIEGARILVVEDAEGTREALTDMLGLCGAVVQAAESAKQAMKAFEASPPDLLVSDVAMPDEDGYSLIRRIRALGPEHGGGVHALALTALVAEEDRQRAFAAGFQAHLAKPVDMDRLVRTLAELRRRR